MHKARFNSFPSVNNLKEMGDKLLMLKQEEDEIDLAMMELDSIFETYLARILTPTKYLAYLFGTPKLLVDSKIMYIDTKSKVN